MTENKTWIGLPVLDYDKLHKAVKENLTDAIRKYNVPVMVYQGGVLKKSDEKKLYYARLICFDKNGDKELAVRNSDDFNFYGISVGEQTFFKTFFDADYTDDELTDILIYLYLRTAANGSYAPLIDECMFRAGKTYRSAGAYFPHANAKRLIPVFTDDVELTQRYCRYCNIVCYGSCYGRELQDDEWSEEVFGKHIIRCVEHTINKVSAYWLNDV